MNVCRVCSVVVSFAQFCHHGTSHRAIENAEPLLETGLLGELLEVDALLRHASIQSDCWLFVAVANENCHGDGVVERDAHPNEGVLCDWERSNREDNAKEKQRDRLIRSPRQNLGHYL